MNIIKPQKLRKGDYVGIVSPSGFISDEQKNNFDNGIKFLEDLGLKVKIGQNVFNKHFYNAGTKQERIDDFNDMWRDEEVKMILMSQGGQTANHLLDGIDYEYIRNNPKIFSGISDGTTLLTAIHAKTGLVAYHGPDLLWSLGRIMSDIYKNNFIQAFFEGDVKEYVHDKNWLNYGTDEKDSGWKILKPGIAKGRLIGGHTNSFSNTISSGYKPNFDGSILFFEGTSTTPQLDQQLTALKLKGVFENINGLIIGWFADLSGYKKSNPNEYREVSDIILEITEEYNFPILEVNEIGHNVQNYIIPIGIEVEMDADNKIIKFNEDFVL